MTRPSRSSVDEPDDWSDSRNLHPDPVRRALDEAPQGAVSFRVLGDPEPYDEVLDGLAVAFRVLGVPVPKGSLKSIGRGRPLVDANDALPAWSQAVAVEAEQAARHLGEPLTGPVGLDLTFRFRMAQTRARSRAYREAGQVPHWHWPDLDKLVRAIGDALQASGLISNDGQIAALAARKDEVLEGWTGCAVFVRQLAPTIARRDL